MESTAHTPVLLKQAMEYLAVEAGETVVDATLGGGGYTRALLERVGRSGRVVAIDTDERALARFEKRLSDKERHSLVLRKANFSELDTVLDDLEIPTVDAIVADLGFSSDQMEDPARGLSFMKDGLLDMRLDQSSGVTAEEIIATYPEAELAALFFRYGDEPEARRIARAIVRRRQEEPIRRTGELAEVIREAYPKSKAARSRIHPATKTFQALRIAVNREDEHLVLFLRAALGRLRQGGRIAVVSFHSGEDRLVKNFFRDMAKPCVCPPNFPKCVCDRISQLRVLTKKPIVPEEAEILANPRARSAVLRAAEKL